jgi:hypothetical protein
MTEIEWQKIEYEAASLVTADEQARCGQCRSLVGILQLGRLALKIIGIGL